MYSVKRSIEVTPDQRVSSVGYVYLLTNDTDASDTFWCGRLHHYEGACGRWPTLEAAIENELGVRAEGCDLREVR